MQRRTDRFWALLVLLFLQPILVYSQISGDGLSSNRGGINTVTGLIFTPGRTPVGRGILVRLSKGANDYTAWTDQDGKFFIAGVGNGTYTVTAEAGDEFEPESQRLEIAQPRSAPPQTFYVNIQLRRKRDALGKPGVIDAGMVNVPEKAQQHYRNAQEAGAKGNPQGAVDELLRAVAEYPEFATAHAQLGIQLQKLNQLEKADEHLLLALKLKPGAYEPLANRGVVLVRLKKHEEADAVFREALKIRDDSALVHFYLGRALVGQKRPDDAEAEFRIALRMGGNDMIEAHRALANIYLQRGENEKALSELETYLAANPKPADEKKLRDTIQQIKEMLKTSPKP